MSFGQVNLYDRVGNLCGSVTAPCGEWTKSAVGEGRGGAPASGHQKSAKSWRRLCNNKIEMKRMEEHKEALPLNRVERGSPLGLPEIGDSVRSACHVRAYPSRRRARTERGLQKARQGVPCRLERNRRSPSETTA